MCGGFGLVLATKHHHGWGNQGRPSDSLSMEAFKEEFSHAIWAFVSFPVADDFFRAFSSKSNTQVPVFPHDRVLASLASTSIFRVR